MVRVQSRPSILVRRMCSSSMRPATMRNQAVAASGGKEVKAAIRSGGVRIAAFDPVFNFAGFGVDECDLVDGALEVYDGADGGRGILVGGAAGGVEHAGGGKCARVELTHGAFGVVEDEVVVEDFHGFCMLVGTNVCIFSELSKHTERLII